MSTHNDWRQHGERSNRALIRLMVWISLTFGRGIGRVVLRGIAAYYVLFAPHARHASQDYLRRALGRAPRWRDVYRHIFSFCSTVHDRIYLLNDRFDLFKVEIAGAEHLHATLARQPGALLVGAHFGSFEILRAAGREVASLQVAMLMFEDNARMIGATVEAINPQARQDIIALGQLDSMLQAHERLERGALVGMLADRGLGDDAGTRQRFLGDEAVFPLGPWRMAAMLKRPVFFMAGVHLGGNRYRIHFEPLADFSDVPRGARNAAIEDAARAYAVKLEGFCRQHPYNWFNFFRFWQQK